MVNKLLQKQPRVSVCIPSYNHGKYIASAIESVLGQKYDNFELVIIDDFSHDSSDAIIRKYAAYDKRIKFYRNNKNLGMVENWNLCLERATGDFVKVMGADDLLEPSCLEKSVNVLVENPKATLLSCARTLIDKEGRPIRISGYSRKFSVSSGIKIIKKCFFTANLIGEPTATMFRKKDALRGFNQRYRQLTDLEMWFHLLEKGDFAYIPEPLCYFRVHPEQTTKVNVKTMVFMNDEFLLYHDYIGRDYLGETFIHRQHWKIKLCITIWAQQFAGLDKSIIKAEIRKYIPLSLFYPLAVLKILIDWVMKLLLR